MHQLQFAMLRIALAYSIEDQLAAERIANDLAGYVEINHYGVETTTGGALLAGMLDAEREKLVVLLSDHFLRNANCLFGAGSFLVGRPDVLIVSSRTRSYDEDLQEMTVKEIDLSNPLQRSAYLNLWHDSRQDLIEKTQDLNLTQNNPFRRYVDRVSGLYQSLKPLLEEIGEQPVITELDLENNGYALLFSLLDEPAVHASFVTHQSNTIAGVPGLNMLDSGAAAGAEKEGGIRPKAKKKAAKKGPPKNQEGNVEEDEVVTEKPKKSPVTYELDADGQAELWISRAWDMYENGDKESGLELLAGGRERLPDHPDVAYNYALMLAMDTESPEIALVELNKVLEDFHDHKAALFLSGELSLVMGDHESAYLDWIQLRDVDPLYPDLNYRLGTLINEHFPNRSSEAITYLRRAARDEPLSGDARYRYGMMLYTHLGSTKKSIKWLKRAIDVSPDHAAAHYALAVLMHRRGKLTAARNFYRTAIHLDPAYDTLVNQEAFAQKLRFKSDSSNRGKKALHRMQTRIEELEAALLREGGPNFGPDPAPASAPGVWAGSGKIAFISGATSGIGRATAKALARDGYRLILLGRRTERLEELGREFESEHGVSSHLITADVRDREAIREAVASLPTEWQAIDLLLNNAGKAKGFDPIHEGNYDHWDEMIDVNLRGLLTLTREVSPLMVARGAGTIINVCSTAGKEVYPNGNVYCATKHAVDALTYAMRLDLVKHGIRVGQICPAHVEETEFAVVRFDGDRERANIYDDFQPLRSRDVAEAVCFMANQPAHINIMDVVLQGTQQASSTVVDRSGRDKFAPKE